MRVLIKCILFCGLVVLCAQVCHGSSYPVTNLDDYCGRTLELGCPARITKGGRVGTFGFREMPESNCTVTFRFARDLGLSVCRYTPTLYFNFRQVYLSDNAILDIYTTQDSPIIDQDRTLVKHIPGGRLHHNSDPASVAQLKTRFEHSSSEMTVEYVSDGASAELHELMIDYAILTDDAHSNEEWCSALGAYISRDTVCLSDDRIVCPYDYYAAVGLNPATGFGGCGLGAGAIAGIVIGSVLGAAVLCAVCVVCCSLSKKVPAVTGSSNRVSSPVVVSGYTPAETKTAPAPLVMPSKDGPLSYPAHGVFQPLPHPEELRQSHKY